MLLRGKGLVKTIRFDKPRYIGDPINAVHIFNDLEADELIFLDIAATREKRCISVDVVKQIGDEAFMPFAVGGGIGNLEQIESLFRAGAEKIVINSAAFQNPGLIRQAAKHFGSQSIVVSIDVKKTFWNKGRVRIRAGRTKTGLDPIEWARRVQDLGAGEIMLTSIDCDGMMQGYDLDLIKGVSDAVTLPVIACGGAGRLEHLRECYDQGRAHAMAAGSLFVYHGPRKAVLINYPSRAVLMDLFHDGSVKK